MSIRSLRPLKHRDTQPLWVKRRGRMEQMFAIRCGFRLRGSQHRNGLRQGRSTIGALNRFGLHASDVSLGRM